jgi:hypothetical protein
MKKLQKGYASHANRIFTAHVTSAAHENRPLDSVHSLIVSVFVLQIADFHRQHHFFFIFFQRESSSEELGIIHA